MVVWEASEWGDLNSLVIVDDSSIAVKVLISVLVEASVVLVNSTAFSWNIAVGIEPVVLCLVDLALSDALIEVNWVGEAWSVTLGDVTRVVFFPQEAGAVLLVELVAISIEDVEAVAGLLAVYVSDIKGFLLVVTKIDGVEDG